MATLAESFMADLADLSDDSAGSDDERQQGAGDVLDGADLLVGCLATLCSFTTPCFRCGWSGECKRPHVPYALLSAHASASIHC